MKLKSVLFLIFLFFLFSTARSEPTSTSVATESASTQSLSDYSEPTPIGGFYLQAGGGYSWNSTSQTGFNAALAGGVQVTRHISLLTSAEVNYLSSPLLNYYFEIFSPETIVDLSLSESVQYELFPGNPLGLYFLGGVGMDFIQLQSPYYSNTFLSYFGFQGGLGTELKLESDLCFYAEGRFRVAATFQDFHEHYSFIPVQAGLKLALGNGQTAPVSATSSSPQDLEINPWMEGNRFFFKSPGVLGSLLGGDLGKGINAFNNQYPNNPFYVNGQGGGENNSVDNLTVFQYGLEAGYVLDPYNGFSLAYSGGQGASLRLEYESFSNGGVEIDQDLYLRLEQYKLNYYHYLPDREGRWYATLGAAYVVASADYSYDSGNSTNEIAVSSTSPLTGSGWGASIGVGREWVLFEDIGVDLSVRGMTGNISSLQGTYASSTNSGPTAAGKGALVMNSNNQIGLLDLNNIAANNARYLTVDLTGINAAFSVNLYY